MVFLKISFEERNGVFSPNGRWLAYMSNESGRYEIYIRPFVAPTTVGAVYDSATAGQSQVSTGGGIYPKWGPDGKELYYLGPNGEMMAAPVKETISTLELVAPVALLASGFPDQSLNQESHSCILANVPTRLTRYKLTSNG